MAINTKDDVKIRITADTNKADKELKKFDKTVSSKSTQYKNSFDKMRISTEGLTHTLGVLRNKLLLASFAISGLVAIKKLAIDAALQQEKAEQELKVAIDKNINSYKEFASSIQDVTIFGDELILSQMAFAKNLGVSENQLKETTTAAIGLSAKLRIDLNSAMQIFGRLASGGEVALSRYGIALEKGLTPQEKFNKLLEIGNNNFKLAEEQAKTAEGSFKQLGNTLGDLGENIGSFLLPGLSQTAKDFNDIVKNVNKAITANNNYIKSMKAVQTEADLISGTGSIFGREQAERYAAPEQGEIEFDMANREAEILKEIESKKLSDIGLMRYEEAQAWLNFKQSDLEQLRNIEQQNGEWLLQDENERLLELEENLRLHIERKKSLEFDFQEAKHKIKEQQHKKDLKNTQKYLGMLEGLQSSHSRTMFEAGKVAAIANATISTYQGAAQALKDIPFPFNIAAAAAVIASGFAQVQAINSTSFGSGATGSGGVGVEMGTTSQPVPLEPTAEESGLNINVVVLSQFGQTEEEINDKVVSVIVPMIEEEAGKRVNGINFSGSNN